MTLCEIYDMDIVANAGSVLGLIVIAEDTEADQLSDCNLGDVRKQVIRHTLRVLSHASGFVCADRVKVAEQHDIPVRIRGVEVGQNLFEHRLGSAVGIRDLSLRALFRNRNKGRIAIDGCTRGEDNILDAVLPHALTEHQGACDIVVIVLERFIDGLADSF